MIVKEKITYYKKILQDLIKSWSIIKKTKKIYNR